MFQEALNCHKSGKTTLIPDLAIESKVRSVFFAMFLLNMPSYWHIYKTFKQ